MYFMSIFTIRTISMNDGNTSATVAVKLPRTDIP